ncbi:acylneuraminate cytidylyltransferase [Agromyces cerinus]|uniref:N-acylneuraminate cytidylyltransferase n=1 Tax=Agromyces cerinus subsp. cerinus TaxID=232089 RepID=A0A1N6FJ83_9MICO|nr:acylneuraminate cytidylyltransferase [Agromyces cerinus]SIN95353.1 N-acylneuraminate cytidylyltransferase [Agromyces cerinus subsp. cerinus]
MARVELVEAPRAAVSPAPATRPDSRAIGSDAGRADGASARTTARATAIIPARGGSVGLPGKNLARVGGVPLIVRAVHAALAAERIDRVVVSTDDIEIADAARAAGASVVDRPAELAGSTASSESALLHALDELELRDALGPLSPGPLGGFIGVEGDERRPGDEHPVTVFIQATSPFIDPADLDAAIARVASGERDVVFSGAPSHLFLWRDDADADSAVGVNHDSARRFRRQEREPEYLETGAFYVFATEGFRSAGHRFFGRIGIQPVDVDHAIEIDELADLERARALAAHVDRGLAASARPGSTRGAHDSVGPRIDVDALVTDFDGVHTDDTVMVDQLGRESVRVSRSDGAGIARLRAAGIPVLILSAEQNPVVGRRAEKLGVECAQGVEEKGAVLREWAERRGIRLDRIAYLGNDRGDLPALELVGWPIAVPDAAAEALAAARHVLTSMGGHGAVRELADLILAARDSAATNEDPDPATARS